ncbi:MAG: polysaccharide pyruvyl transferase family protein, partial [Kiritimatiellia bacterium]|nr:polysaccharide pyruvyl transferase family protein [Kiritimatiellia bacterium]
ENYKAHCNVLPMPFVAEDGGGLNHGKAWESFERRWGTARLRSFRQGTLTTFDTDAIVDDLMGTYAQERMDELRETNPAAAAAFENAGFVYYNSGTTLNYGRLGVKNLWGYTLPLALPLILARHLGIPYGIGSQSFDALEGPMDRLYRKLFPDARFVYCRDTDSLNYLSQQGLLNASSGFRPDTTFFFNLFDDAWAEAFMTGNGLETDRFMSVMLRISAPAPQFNDPTGGVVTEDRKANQMRKMKILIEEWIRRTGCRVLICHETRHTLKIARTALYDTLSEAARKQCVYMDDFWTSAQAFSVFQRSRLVCSMEMHSIIMAINVGTPILHNPYDECGRKKYMVRDLGLGDALIDIDSCGDQDMVKAALRIHENFHQIKAYLKNLKPTLEARCLETLQEVWTHGRWQDV